ncbi:hypothetical protein GCM10010371_32160 [Streptomyces subrutilus]|uniref:Uncharacterized protein n=1 Tax=Streptomyces subrutilus TaxID=36818 RepID=A0A918QRS5_9ACTN|nr:hypothetical protein GCM10010371_32160 [Streptomyces subrutilus]
MRLRESGEGYGEGAAKAARGGWGGVRRGAAGRTFPGRGCPGRAPRVRRAEGAGRGVRPGRPAPVVVVVVVVASGTAARAGGTRRAVRSGCRSTGTRSRAPRTVPGAPLRR